MFAFHTVCTFEIRTWWRLWHGEFSLDTDESLRTLNTMMRAEVWWSGSWSWWGQVCDASLTYTECILNRRNSGIPSVYVTRDTRDIHLLLSFSSLLLYSLRPLFWDRSLLQHSTQKSWSSKDEITLILYKTIVFYLISWNSIAFVTSVIKRQSMKLPRIIPLINCSDPRPGCARLAIIALQPPVWLPSL